MEKSTAFFIAYHYYTVLCTYMDVKARIQELLEKHGAKHWSFAAKKDADLVSEINIFAPDTSIPFPERVLIAMGHDPICPKGNRKKYGSITTGWKFCGKTGQCACASDEVSRKCRDNIDHAARLAKTSATLLERYGSTNPGQTPAAKLAHQSTYNDPERVQLAVERGRATMRERYGVDNALQLDIINREAIARRHWSDYAKTVLDDRDLLRDMVNRKSVPAVSEELGVSTTTVNKYIAEYDIRTEYGSSFETEIADFLKSHGISFLSRNRTEIYPKELDFYLSDFKLAIEFNGLYWHSSQVVSDNAHRTKYEACTKAGIRLLMINEDEWLSRSNVIKNKILILCGKAERGDGARKLIIRPIAAAQAMNFCDLYHIQGAPSSVISAYGAFDKNEQLVAIVCFNRQRRTQDLELIRYCTDGKLYAGVFTKILNFARRELREKIISFADLRYSDGGIYKRSGFECVAEIRPDYRYVKRSQTFHKSNFTKSRIAAKFGIDMRVLTEREAMESLGYSRIYDCGKLKYILVP